MTSLMMSPFIVFTVKMFPLSDFPTVFFGSKSLSLVYPQVWWGVIRTTPRFSDSLEELRDSAYDHTGGSALLRPKNMEQNHHREWCVGVGGS